MFKKLLISALPLALLSQLPSAWAQCDGSCQNNTFSCPTSYKSNLCPGPDNIQCCTETTPYCNGQCQTNSLSCGGKYASGLCPGPSEVQCCIGTQPFADRYWNCGDVGCTYTVSSGSSQPNYQCAEFVARSLAAGGYIPGLSGLESQSKYDPWSYGGKSYDLLWVSQKQGGPLGLREALMALGWTNTGSSSIKKASAVICNGSNGAYSHVAVGVGSNLCDAHNNARYHISPCNTYYVVNEVLNPPGDGETEVTYWDWPEQTEPYVPHAERIARMEKEQQNQVEFAFN